MASKEQRDSDRGGRAARPLAAVDADGSAWTAVAAGRGLPALPGVVPAGRGLPALPGVEAKVGRRDPSPPMVLWKGWNQ